MFGTFAITALLATLAGTAYADVTPNVPGPGVVYKVGGTCHIEWDGDTASTTAWKDMSIQLMTGDNFNMVQLSTVATGLDGTVSGTFDHVCPDVNPYSAIYFYQFTAPGASDKQWTTRFAIASASGQTTPPAESTQPGTGAAIPWGTGQLVGAASGAASSSSPASSPVSSSTSSSALVTPTPTPASTGSSSTAKMVTITTSNTASSTSAPSAGSTTANTTSSASGKDNGAIGLDMKLWKTAVALGTSAMAFALLL